ncbi:DUF6332 family protein [Actinacidiphila acidipaludis]|uniref:DUF6332 family protein n=1 Tax=Actinacidiphila acidipaludis TaxID=2873382 RepID=A0ABS7QH55_9ACTN|nr:DUF6332 family protein [Streptomyces acidipaludis]MBY8882503.1 DUF6332 family protein [Streptomyces acidipaludis]
MRRGRTGAERDAVTVEIAYAALVGAVLAAVGFLAVAGPALAGAVHGQVRKESFAAAAVLAAAVFCGWVARTLRRFERQNRLPAADTAGADGPPPRVPRQRAGPPEGGPAENAPRPPGDHPSQPGRTSPDS